MESPVSFVLSGAGIAALGVLVLIFAKPITRFLKLHYARTYIEGFARLITAWSTRVWGAAAFVLGCGMLVYSALSAP